MKRLDVPAEVLAVTTRDRAESSENPPFPWNPALRRTTKVIFANFRSLLLKFEYNSLRNPACGRGRGKGLIFLFE